MNKQNNSARIWLNTFAINGNKRPWGIIVLGIVLIALAGGLVWGSRSFLEASRWVVHTNQVRVDVETILVSINEAESTHRGFLLSNDMELRRQSLMAQGKALELVKELPMLVIDNPLQHKKALVLEQLVTKRFDLIENVAHVYQTKGFEEAHKTWLLFREGNQLPEQTRALATEMVKEEHRLLQARQKRTGQLAVWVEIMAISGMGISIALVLLNGMAYRRERRVHHRAAQSTQLAHDQLAESLADIEKEHVATQALANFASLLQGCQTIEDIFQVAKHSINNILPNTSGTFYLMRTSRDHVEAQADWGQAWPERPDSFMPVHCWGMRQGRSFKSVPHQLCCPHRQGQTTVSMDWSTCVPMTAQGSEVGLLFIQHPEKWNGSAMAEAVSEQLALAITNMRLRETLRTQSLRDPLTGLSNRREIDEQLPREIARSQQDKQPMSLLVLDIDHFKRFNDRFGHDAGDDVLREFSHTLRQSVRTQDIVARMGGEEFMIVLLGTNAKQAQQVADHIRVQVEAMNVSHRGISLGKVTTSIGVAECPQHATDAQTLITMADAALYQAKNQGRNRVAVAAKQTLHLG